MKNKAFTLAEVLITLTIIGVIAAITIPNLMKKWEEAHTVSAVKEAYAILNNAFKSMISEEGYLTDWAWPESGFGDSRFNFEFPNYLTEKLKPYIKINKVYTSVQFKQETGIDVMGASSTHYKNLLGGQGAPFNQDKGRNVLLLANGMTIELEVTQDAITNRHTTTYTVNNGWGVPGAMGSITVDINGYKKGPNRWGYDIFAFEYFYDGLNFKRYTSWGSPASSYYCDYTLNDWRNGRSCVYWVLVHGNTDYQRRQVKKAGTTGDWVSN